jgi:hypothetical protein
VCVCASIYLYIYVYIFSVYFICAKWANQRDFAWLRVASVLGKDSKQHRSSRGFSAAKVVRGAVGRRLCAAEGLALGGQIKRGRSRGHGHDGFPDAVFALHVLRGNLKDGVCGVDRKVREEVALAVFHGHVRLERVQGHHEPLISDRRRRGDGLSVHRSGGTQRRERRGRAARSFAWEVHPAVGEVGSGTNHLESSSKVQPAARGGEEEGGQHVRN